MQVVSGGMLAGVTLFLSVVLFMRFTSERSGGLALMSYGALALGLLSPVLAAAVDRSLAAQPTDPASGVNRIVQRHLVTCGILEGAALFCAMALTLSPDLLPLAAALVPVGTMVLKFPRAS